jgi:phosphoglucosamine mutase
VLASAWQKQGRLRGPVIGTLMTNFGLEQAFGARGIGFERAKVGDRHVLQKMKEHGGTLGGETSGHVLCLDRASTGDGIVSALQVLEAVRRDGDLADLVRGWQRLPQTTVNVRTADAAAALDDAGVQAARMEVERQLAGRGRLVLRPSGTEPLIRVTVEAADAGLVDALVRRLAQAVESAAT